MNNAILLAPAVLVVAGLAAAPSQAHEPVVTATVGIPPLTVEVGGVVVTLGRTPPPVVVERRAPRQVVVVEEAPRPRDRVVYVEHGKKKHCHTPRGHGYGAWKHRR